MILFVVIFVLWAFYYLFQKPENRKSLSQLLSERTFPKDTLLIIRYIDDEYLFEEYLLEQEMTVSIDVSLKEEIIISLEENDENWTITHQTHPLTMQFNKAELVERRHFNFTPKQSGHSSISFKGDTYNNVHINFQIL